MNKPDSLHNTDKQPLLRLEQLGKAYPPPSELQVLQGVELELAAGEAIAVVGSSGCGKTTLLHILGTLDHPTGGRVLFDGEDIFQWSPEKLADFRNRAIGFIFQFHHLLPEFSARENIMLPGLIGRLPRGEVSDRATHLLEQVGLANRGHHRVGELSGGEQQRVAIARALIMRPRLLLADEPTGNLDPQTGQQVFELLQQLNSELGLSMVMVTHNYGLAGRLNRVLQLADGQLREISREQLPAL
ncbi:MAG: ABC transporter ATP-binding protein [Desulfurivibrio sp.]|nr:ABC transporter ATP-binding protein [Desulfurivibrio sp.]